MLTLFFPAPLTFCKGRPRPSQRPPRLQIISRGHADTTAIQLCFKGNALFILWGNLRFCRKCRSSLPWAFQQRRFTLRLDEEKVIHGAGWQMMVGREKGEREWEENARLGCMTWSPKVLSLKFGHCIINVVTLGESDLLRLTSHQVWMSDWIVFLSSLGRAGRQGFSLAPRTHALLTGLPSSSPVSACRDKSNLESCPRRTLIQILLQGVPLLLRVRQAYRNWTLALLSYLLAMWPVECVCTSTERLSVTCRLPTKGMKASLSSVVSAPDIFVCITPPFTSICSTVPQGRCKD